MATERIFYNRLSGTCRNTIADTPMGIWLLEIEDGAAFLNSALVQHFDYLVPDRSGQWRLTSEDDTDIDRGRGHGEKVPESLERESVERLANELTADGRDPSWLERLDISPVAPGLSEEIELKPLDLAIRKYLPFLEAVCHRPKAHLQIEIEKVHSSVARRIPPQAVPYLSAHTEDWEQPTLRGVRPKKVLSEIREDQYDIYENRLSINLLNHLSRYLQVRLRELKRVQTTLEEQANHAAKAGGAHRRSERICRLWGQVVNADRAQNRLKETHRIIRALAYRVDGLMHSPLYLEIPTRARLPDQLKSTNIFINDSNYHNVSRLWTEWLRHRPKDSAETPLMLYQKLQSFGRSFDEFCLLLVVRALDQLRIEPLDEALDSVFRARGGQVLQLRDKKELVCKQDGTFELRGPQGILVTIVPLPLVIGSTEEASAHSLRRISEEVVSSPHPVLLLHLSGQGNDHRRLPPKLARKLQMAGNEIELELPKQLSVMPVSPWEIDSVERVARALRWWILGRALSFYPANAGPIPSILKLPTVPWLRLDGGSLTLLRNPTNEEVDELELQDRLHELNQRIATRRTRRNEAEQVVRPAVDCVTHLNELLRKVPVVMQCPVCTSSGNTVKFYSGAEGYTRFTCPNCNAGWGCLICRHCHGKIPTLETANELQPDPTIPGSVDDTLGCDVLSVPMYSEHGRKSFLCPECGVSGK